jgi:nicotinate phosphoribosyltransferase
MAFPSEEEAFDAYAELYPDKTVFLIDTYDTLKSGILNAVKSGKKLAAQGKKFGVRLDSGDMHYLSVQVRKILDDSGLNDATSSVSNDLDEWIIQTLTNAGAPINSWGVGTSMVTGGTDAAFTGVYKLVAKEDDEGALVPAIKFSDNPEKTTTPGLKQVWRIRDTNGMAVADVLALDGETPEKNSRCTFWHPSADYRHFYHTLEGTAETLLRKRMQNGELTIPHPSLEEVRKTVKADLELFDISYKRILNPHIYKVSVTGRLRALKLELMKSYLGEL